MRTMTPLRRRLGIAWGDIRRARRGQVTLRVLARMLVLVLVVGHDTELCYDCGCRYNRTLWWAPNELWTELVTARPGDASGYAPGLLCPGCFNDRAKRAGIVLTWTPMVSGWREHGEFVPSSNYWCDPTRDRLLVGEPDPNYLTISGHARAPQPPWPKIAHALGWDETASFYPRPES